MCGLKKRADRAFVRLKQQTCTCISLFMSRELLALFERRPPEDARLRKRLLANAGLGGARPKTTIQDDQQFWLIKPRLATDLVDIPQLEHWAHQLGSACGLNFASTVLHQVDVGLSVLR